MIMSSRTLPLCLPSVLLLFIIRLPLWLPLLSAISVLRWRFLPLFLHCSGSGIFTLSITLLLSWRRSILALLHSRILLLLSWFEIIVRFRWWSRGWSFLLCFISLLIFYWLQRLFVFCICKIMWRKGVKTNVASWRIKEEGVNNRNNNISFRKQLLIHVNLCPSETMTKKSHCIKISLKKYVYIIFSKSTRQEILVRLLGDTYYPDNGAPKSFTAKKARKRKD